MGACVLALAVEGSIKQSKRGGALCAQANIFERVVRIVRVWFLGHGSVFLFMEEKFAVVLICSVWNAVLCECYSELSRGPREVTRSDGFGNERRLD